MGNAFNLGRLFGIQFRLHYTWFIIFALVTFSLVHPYWLRWLYWVMGIVTTLLFFASVLAHELAHSLVGRVNGIPVKSITLFIFGGIALMSREAARPGAEFKMAAAGPACSLVIGGLFGLVWLFTSDRVEPVAAMASWLAYINGGLAAFNLIPGFPLDGGRVFRSILWRVTNNYQRSTRIATLMGRGVGYLFILAGISIIFIRRDAWFDGLWLAFIGWFLENAALASYRQAQWREAFQGFTAAQVMTSNFPVVPSNITISELVQGYVFPAGHQFFMVTDEGRLEGILTLRDIKLVSRLNWNITQVGEIMTPVSKLKVASPSQNVLSILEQMDESDINEMPVVSEGRVIGLVARGDLVRLFQTRSRLGI